MEKREVFLGDRDPDCVYSRSERATGEGGIGNVKEESKYMMDETLENGGQEEKSSE